MKISRNTMEWIIGIGVITFIVSFLVMLMLWSDGIFKGTLMQDLLPALAYGVVFFLVTAIIVGNLLTAYPYVSWIAGGVMGAIMFVLQICGAENATIVVGAICAVIACVLVVVKWIQRNF